MSPDGILPCNSGAQTKTPARGGSFEVAIITGWFNPDCPIELPSIVGARPACDCSFDSRAGLAPTRNFPANGFFGFNPWPRWYSDEGSPSGYKSFRRKQIVPRG